ncbi:MAG: VWA domain-containing protein [Ignisphaera sp.]
MPGVLKHIDYQDPFTRYKGQKIIDNLRRLKNRGDIPLDLAIDVYYSLYLPFPSLNDLSQISIGTEKHYKIIKTILTDKDARKLRLYTVADSFASVALGTLFLINVIEDLEGKSERIISQSSGRNRSGSKEQDRDAKESDGSEGKDIESLVKKAIRKTLDSAETIKDVEHFVYGYKAGVGHVLNLEDDVASVIRLVKNTDIKNILMLLAKVPDVTAVTRKKKIVYQRGEVEGYTQGSDIERIVYTEFAYPQLYFYIKLADGNLLLFEKIIHMNIGPIYLLVDKSGSMDGNKILWAKATALALFMKSRAEHRFFYIRFFDSEPYELFKISPSARPSEAMKLVEYIAMVKNGGGTDISKALITACNDIAKLRTRELSEIILITDGEDRIARSLVKKALQHTKTKLVTVMIMGENEDLRSISSDYFKVVKLSEKEIISVVKA